MYTIKTKIGRKNLADITIKSDNGNYAFHLIMNIVYATREEAYETSSSWSVFAESDAGKVEFRSDGDRIRTFIDGDDKGNFCWDSYLSSWV